MQPAQIVLTYVASPSSGAVVVDIDLAKDLSAVNRRLYRQGMQYAVGSVTCARTLPGLSAYVCQTAGNTWVVHNAWKKASALWEKQQRDAARDVGVKRGTWADFKVTLDDNDTAAIDTIAGDGGTIVPDEWNYSELVFEDDGDEWSPTMHLLGTSTLTSGVGLVQEYAISRTTVTSPDPNVPSEASDSIYAKMALMGSDEFSDVLIDDIEGHNDSPPYDMSEYVGGDTVADAPFNQDFVTSTMENPGQSRPFLAECGLLRITLQSVEADGSTASDVPHLIQVRMVPGGYKGVLAEPMGQ